MSAVDPFPILMYDVMNTCNSCFNNFNWGKPKLQKWSVSQRWHKRPMNHCKWIAMLIVIKTCRCTFLLATEEFSGLVGVKVYCVSSSSCEVISQCCKGSGFLDSRK